MTDSFYVFDSHKMTVKEF